VLLLVENAIKELDRKKLLRMMSSKVTVTPSSVTVTVKLLSSSGKGLSGSVVQYYSSAWKSFGTTGSDGTVSVALPTGTYNFQITYAGASQQKSQNVLTNPTLVFVFGATQQNSQDVSKDPNVKFQTVQVHSDSGKCTSYYAGGWKTFTQDMQLLPGTYTFRFSDGTATTSYTMVAGPVKRIH
jgi:hypothetical protein